MAVEVYPPAPKMKACLLEALQATVDDLGFEIRADECDFILIIVFFV